MGKKKLERKILRIVDQSLYTKGKLKTCVTLKSKEAQLGEAAWEGLVFTQKRKAGLRPAGTNNPRSTDYNQETVEETAYDS